MAGRGEKRSQKGGGGADNVWRDGDVWWKEGGEKNGTGRGGG